MVAAAVAAARASFEAAAQVADEPKGASDGETRWLLQCSRSEGLTTDELTALPADLRSIPVSNGFTLVGVRHQPDLFEGLLARAPRHLTFISRNHVQLEVRLGGRLKIITNMSANPVYVGGEQLLKGDSRDFPDDGVLEFVRQDGNRHAHFLAFQLKPASRPFEEGCQPCSPAAAGKAGPGVAQGGAAPVPAAAPVPPPAASAGQARAASPQRPAAQEHSDALQRRGVDQAGDAPKVARSPERKLDPRRSDALRATDTPAAAAAPQVAAAPPPSTIVLELFGEGVHDVPASERRIGPTNISSQPLVVGRRHQLDMLRTVVKMDCLKFVSRDHFRISLENGEYRLTALTANPIWRDRQGTVPRELQQDETATLRLGDTIAVGTGEDASEPEDKRKRLRWNLRAATESELRVMEERP